MPLRMRVADAMTAPVITALPTATLGELAETMLEHRIGSVVIVESDESGAVAGIVTETDFGVGEAPVPFTLFRWPRLLDRWVWSEDSLEEGYREARERPAAAIMSTPVQTVEADAELWQAVETMLRHDVKHVPVVRDGRLVGIVARHDLLRCLAADAAETVDAAPAVEALVPSPFDRVVCGVDGSDQGLEALRQAMRLRSPHGRLVALTAAADLRVALRAGGELGRASEAIAAEAEAVRARAAEALGDAGEARVAPGKAVAELLALARAERAGLVVVGTHGLGRAAGLLIGSAATALLRTAPCPVLVARAPAAPEDFPRRIVVGFDGSGEAGRALAVAHELGERFGAVVRTVSATGGKPLDEARLRGVRDLETEARPPVDALVAASAEADLLVLGSRGRHGRRALGSVSERVAHRARCSVLVVRPPAA